MSQMGRMKSRIKYVYEETDRHGKRRVYFRRRAGEPKIPLPHPTAPDFARAYADVLDRYDEIAAERRQARKARPGVATVAAGTLRALCVAYFKSPEFRQLTDRTQYVRRQVIEHCLQEPIAPGAKEVFADFPVNRLTPKAIRVLRDRKADLPGSANNRIKAMRQVFAWGVSADEINDNPARNVPYFSKATDGFHTWTTEEIEQYEARHPIGTKARLALALLLFVGVRRSDVVKLGRQMIRDGWIYFTETKGRSRKIKNRAIPVLPQLREIIDATPSDHMTFLVTEFGKPHTANGFGNWFKHRCNEAGLPHCSAHGLRKAGATIAAENGATEHQLMAIWGWESPRQAAIYTRKADRRRLVEDAMHLLIPIKEGTKVPNLESQPRKVGKISGASD